MVPAAMPDFWLVPMAAAHAPQAPVKPTSASMISMRGKARNWGNGGGEEGGDNVMHIEIESAFGDLVEKGGRHRIRPLAPRR